MPTCTETLQDLAANAATTCDRAIVRARFVQAEITRYRERLDYASTPRPLPAGQTLTDVAEAAILASYDRELTRLCQIPGVLSALLAGMADAEVTPR